MEKAHGHYHHDPSPPSRLLWQLLWQSALSVLFGDRGHVHADEDQLMTLDASGKAVPVARSVPARLKASSSTSPSMPSQKHRSSTSGNRSTAASPKPGPTSKASKDRPAAIAIPSGE